MTSGLNQIPLLQIEDMWTDTTSSDVVIYQPGPATLNVKTFLHHVKLMGCYVHSICCVKWFLSARANHHETFNLTVNVTQRNHTRLFPAVTSLFVDVGQVLLLSQHPPPSPPNTHSHTETIKGRKKKKKDEKAKSLADH